jgi:multidrug efflux system outer membrane protein
MKRLVILAGALLAGCALQPTYQRPALPVPGAWPTGAAYGEQPGAGTTPAADVGWRNFLTDARLQRLVEIALANNRDLRVAALHVAQVQAQYRIQRAAQFPSVDANAELRRTGGSGGGTRGYSAGLSAAWELDFFGRLRSLSDAALQQYLASREAQQAFHILLVSQVTDQYLALLASDELLAVTQRTLQSAQASLQLTQLQLRVGSGTELAVRQAETVVEQAQADQEAQVRARAQAENALVLLLGEALPADLPPVVPFNAQAFLTDLAAGVPSDLLQRRPDVMQAEAQLRAANANIGAARAAFFPSISLTGSLGTASSALSGLFGAGSLAWGFIPSITAPIFNAGQLRAELDVAKIEKDIGVAQYEKAIQTAFSEVASGLAARSTYDRQVAALERLVTASQQALDLAQLQFRTGTASYLAVLTEQRNLYGAQQELVQVRLARMTNLVDLYRYLGGGWRERTGA